MTRIVRHLRKMLPENFVGRALRGVLQEQTQLVHSMACTATGKEASYACWGFTSGTSAGSSRAL